MKRIAIFQYNWLLQGYTRDLVIGLGERNFWVDFFIDQASLDSNLIDPKSLVHPHVQIYKLQGSLPKNFSVFSKLSRNFSLYFDGLTSQLDWLIKPQDFTFCCQVIEPIQDQYQAMIGIEKVGLILAGALAQKNNIPFIYYSLELIFNDLNNSQYLKQQLKLEKKYHQRAIATIIQDKLRGKVLYEKNQISQQQQIHFPVSVMDVSPVKKTSYWQSKFNLPLETKIILYFGFLYLGRRLDDVLRAWNQCPTNYALILHGSNRWDQSGFRKLQNLFSEFNFKNVILSTEIVSEEQIPQLIAASDIGLCTYENEPENERLTAFSSQKIALYLRAGIPIISSHNESYFSLYSQFQCGESLNNVQSLQEIIHKISCDYSSYSLQARQAFEAFYDFEKNIDSLIIFINSL